MIVKSIPIKDKSASHNPFVGLLKYFHKSITERPALTHNLYSQTADTAQKEMDDNLKYLRNRRSNLNAAYHDIISLKPDIKIPRRNQATMLEDIVRYYLSLRAPQCMGYSVIHFDRASIHAHITYTPNGIKDTHRHVISKSAYQKILRSVELYKLEKYPELGREEYFSEAAHQRVKERDKSSPRLKNTERAMKSRTETLSRKERDHFLIKAIFAQARSEDELCTKLKDVGFEIYVRGKHEGVIATDGRKYRLRTLALEADALSTRKRMKLFDNRRAELVRANQQSHNFRER